MHTLLSRARSLLFTAACAASLGAAGCDDTVTPITPVTPDTAGTAGTAARAPLPPGVERGRATTSDGVELHYWRAGQGSPVVLLNGWPQSVYQWRKVVPRLAASHTVIAIDLPGTGRSSAPDGGYDKATTARRIREVVRGLGFSRVNLVGHDIGGMVAFRYAAQYPDEVSALVVAEAPIPGEAFYSLPALTPEGAGVWWFGLHAVPELPEELIVGREREYYGWFYRTLSAVPGAIEDAAVDEYVRTNRGRERVTAGLEYYRAFPQDVLDNQALPQRIATPVLALGGERGVGGLVAVLLEPYASAITPLVLPGVGHWVPEEQPDAFVDAILPVLR